jgi:copper chaperone CopZ
MPNLNHEATAFFKLEGGDESGGHEKLRRVLDALDGVLEVRVNFIIDTISVKYDSDRLTRDEIKKKVDQSNSGSKNR